MRSHSAVRILAAVSALCLLAGCAPSVENGTSLPSSTSAPEETTNLTWYVHYNWYSTPWGGNTVSDTITEKTGVSIDFVTPTGSEKEKLAALMSSDSLPDLITIGWWEPQLQTLMDDGYVLPLNELADTYCPEFYDVADESALNWYRQQDGNVYCYPNSSYSIDDYADNEYLASNQTFLVRKDIYEAIGSPDMTTPEGFADTVRAAAAMFPTVDGKQLIPIGAHAFGNSGCDSFDKFLMNFLAIPFEKDGQFYDRYTDPEYIRWLKMFRELGQEGYLANDIFVDQRAQMDEKIAEGRIFCMLYQRTDLVSAQKARYKQNPDSIYIAVDGPRNAAGNAHTLPGGGISGWTVTLISKKCKDPEKAIQFMTFLMGEEGQKLLSVGVEGENYTMQDGQAVMTPETQALYDSDYDAYVRTVGANDTYWMLQDNVMQSQWQHESDPALLQMQQWAHNYTIYTAQYDLSTTPGSTADAQNQKIEALWGKTLPQLLLAPTEEDFDTLLQDFITKRDALGYADVLADETQRMNEAKQRLGITE